MLKVKIKASAVSNLSDARYFAARGAEWLGFRLETGVEGSLSLPAAKAIKDWVDGVKIVGEFDFSSPPAMLEAAETLGLDAVQVGMFATKNELASLNGIPVFKEVIVQPGASEEELASHLRQFSPACEFFLLDFVKAGFTWQDLKQNRPLPLRFLQETCQNYPVILSLDFAPGELDEMLETLKPAGLNLTGGDEEKVAFKSYDELDEIFDWLELTE
ncbi:MAG: N-(5'-phosphoribosyl)anthranilate isomerase [Bacteroidota bacterium]